MLKKLVSGLLATSFLCSPLALRAIIAPAEEQKNDFYKQLLPYFIDSKQQQEKPATAIVTAAPNAPAPKPKTADVTLRELRANEQIQMTLELLNYALPAASIDQSVIDPLEKFTIVTPGTRDMVSMLMPRGTLWGKIAFARDCTRPFTYNELVQRQEVTRFFVGNSEKAERALSLIKSGQRAYLAYFEQLDETTKQVLDSLYFSDENTMFAPLNTSKTALAVAEAGRWVLRSLNPIIVSGLGMSFINATVNAYGADSWHEWLRVPDKTATSFAKKFFYNNCPFSCHPDTKETEQQEAALARDLMKDEAGLMQKYYLQQCLPLPRAACAIMAENAFVQGKQKMANYVAHIERTKQNPISVQDDYNHYKKISGSTFSAFVPTYGLRIVYDVLLFLYLKNAAAEIAQTNSIYNNYQTRLIGVSKIVRGLTMLADIARSTDSAALGGMAQDIELFLDAAANKDLAALLDALKTETFAGNPSFFSNRPRILATNKLMERCKELFIRPLAAAGQIETFVAAAEYHAKHQETGSSNYSKPVCFVDFVNDAEPRLEFENCWNILVPEDKAVCIDSIALGKNGVCNAIFTGPNGTGKSTNENAIAGIYFMSKFGIACASRATVTPFEAFEVHRNELEDVSKSMSTFMTQKARFDEICERIAHLNGQRMIIFMDEPLNGTVEDEAGRIIYEKCRQLLANQTQAICIIATHAAQPTRLEADTNGAFKNFYLEVFEREPGVFERTYKLRPGLLTQWFDDPEWRHRFVEWLSREVHEAHAANHPDGPMIT